MKKVRVKSLDDIRESSEVIKEKFGYIRFKKGYFFYDMREFLEKEIEVEEFDASCYRCSNDHFWNKEWVEDKASNNKKNSMKKFDQDDFPREDFEPIKRLLLYKDKWIDGKIYREKGKFIVALYDWYDEVYCKFKNFDEITHYICMEEEENEESKS